MDQLNIDDFNREREEASLPCAGPYIYICVPYALETKRDLSLRLLAADDWSGATCLSGATER
uniref:Uncharacterized protein n=1 Tax=Picea glauca TaxID=3330 RepID=A0A101M2T5_PICGL|nr:hypothetical protein ABT39_MTgene3239 [Picea glauca]QHR89263.1 hypothetical protein Q903MT_gene3283 [Picea sitchensis]